MKAPPFLRALRILRGTKRYRDWHVDRDWLDFRLFSHCKNKSILFSNAFVGTILEQLL